MVEVEFQTIKAETIKFGNNNFIEVARKKAITSQGENEFVAISRGFYAPDGSPRFKKSFTIPSNPEVINFVVEKIKEMAAGLTPTQPAEAPTEVPVSEEAAPEQPSEETESIKEVPQE